MNSILPSGLPRFNTGKISNNIKFDYQSVIVGENAGRDLPLGTQNYYNTIVGYNAGRYSVDVFDTIFIGTNSGINIYSGSNNIIIGAENEKEQLVSRNNVLSFGYDNNTATNSMTFGFRNENNGFQNVLFGQYNTIVGNRSICIGNNIDSEVDDAILIGNDLIRDSNVTINVGNSFISYRGSNTTIFIGSNNVPLGIGFDSLMELDPEYSVYCKRGLLADKISVGDANKVSFVTSSNLTTDIKYVLPVLPDKALKNVVLGLDGDNEMIWKKIYINTDELVQGSSNLYYNEGRVIEMVDSRFDANMVAKFDNNFEVSYEKRIPNLSVDRLVNGTSNKMIVNNIYPSDLSVSGRLFTNHLIVNKIEVLGYGNTGWNNQTSMSSDISKMISDTSNNLIGIIMALTERIKELENINQNVRYT